MAIAGRVAIVPKGDWSADATYKRLDAVTHNNTLYFAKKDVPAGTETSNTEYWSKSVVGGEATVDDALSSTSTNPVQNKVVTSNLTNLKYGEVAGGKNLFNGKYIKELISIGTDYTNRNLYDEFSSANDITGSTYVIFGAYLKKGTYTFSYTNDAYFSLNRVAIAGTDCISVTKTIRKSYTWTQNTYGWTYFGIEGDDKETGVVDTPFSITPNIQIEEGTTETSYEPYIPSVKMLAEENAQQSTETMDLKMLGWTVPKEMPVQNYVDSDGVFHQRVGRVDLGDRNYNYNGESNLFYFDQITDAKSFGACVYQKFNGVTGNGYGIDWGIALNETIYNVSYINAPGYTDPATLKHDLTGIYLYYELVEEKTISVDGNEAVTKVNESLSVIGKCKNLLNTTLQTTTQNGVTCTNNGDGTYTLNGTVATGNYEQFTLLSNKISAGTYKLVGNPDYSLGCSLYFSDHGGKEIDYGNGGIVNFASDITTTILYLYIPSGVTLTNVVFKPMLTTNLNATYDDFVPYTGDGETLNVDVAELKAEVANKLDKDNVVNNQTTTEAGFALDARQANPNIDGTLAKQVADLNGSLNDIVLAEEVIIDPLDINNLKNKLYMTNITTKNLPDGCDYGFLFVVGAENNKWRLLIFIPTSLQGIYINFYNAYAAPAGWHGWNKIG